LGLIFCPSDNHSWMSGYASYPWAEVMDDGYIKCYFSCRDANNRSSIGYVIISIDQPNQVLKISEQPVLTKGEIGTFDDSGVSFSCMIEVQNKKYLYYLGWNILTTVPWKNTIGLAIESNASGFKRYSKAPVLGIHDVDPFTLTYPFVLEEEGMFKMWYGSSLFWGPKVHDTLHVIKYATSTDGINWYRTNEICIQPEHEGEFAIVKPFVLKEEGRYKMWYSYRVNAAYLMGYAESEDGIKWQRKDDLVHFSKSDSGWDSEMVCYPFIFDLKGKRYMFYNGNGYGKSGFGLAVLE
jgi:predicted GH43/DUF377 family glycosyl hydrolase